MRKSTGWSRFFYATIVALVQLSILSESLPSSQLEAGVLRLRQQAAALDVALRVTIEDDGTRWLYIAAISADSAGRVYALDTDPKATRVLVFEPSGRFRASIGRSGQGPGEFRDLAHSLAWIGDTLLTVDVVGRQLTGFDRSGRVVLIAKWPHPGPLPRRLLSHGRSVLGLSLVSQNPTVVRHYRIGSDGAVASAMQLVDSITGPRGLMCAAPGQGRDIYGVEIPFKNPVALTAMISPSQLARANPDSFRIEILDVPSGRLVRAISKNVRASPLVDADWVRSPSGSVIRDHERESGGQLVDPSNRSQKCPVYDLIPKQAPPIRSITADDSGRLWVEGTSTTGARGMRLTVFASTGQLLGEANMPERDFRVAPYVRGNMLYTVHSDADGLQSIRTYELKFAK